MVQQLAHGIRRGGDRDVCRDEIDESHERRRERMWILRVLVRGAHERCSVAGIASTCNALAVARNSAPFDAEPRTMIPRRHTSAKHQNTDRAVEIVLGLWQSWGSEPMSVVHPKIHVVGAGRSHKVHLPQSRPHLRH